MLLHPPPHPSLSRVKHLPKYHLNPPSGPPFLRYFQRDFLGTWVIYFTLWGVLVSAEAVVRHSLKRRHIIIPPWLGWLYTNAIRECGWVGDGEEHGGLDLGWLWEYSTSTPYVSACE